MQELMTKLNQIQTELKCNKSLFNAFGRYSYRSTETILESLKPLLKKYKLSLVLSDDVVSLNDRFYIKATATLYDGDKRISASGFAREDESKKGMDLSQLTGSCSSYARKYALNGLFCIDDTKDADSMDNTKEEKPKRRSRIQKQLDDDCPF